MNEYRQNPPGGRPGLSGRGNSVAAGAKGIASYRKLAYAGCSGGPYQGPTQTADRRGEGGAHCASVPHWTAKRVPTVVRGIGEPAPRGGSSPLTASDTTVVRPSPLSDVDGSSGSRLARGSVSRAADIGYGLDKRRMRR